MRTSRTAGERPVQQLLPLRGLPVPSAPGTLVDLRSAIGSWVGEDEAVDPAPAQDWHLDEHTRTVGRRGVAMARALLASGNQRPPRAA